MSEPRVRHVIGCMTGTSLDGLDAALVRITGTALEMSAEFVGMASLPLGELGEALRVLTAGEAYPPIDYMRAARQLGELHADAVEQLLQQHPVNRRATPAKPHEPPPGSHRDPAKDQNRSSGIDFIVAHGQTIWHAPKEYLSWQLFDPWPIVKRLGVPVCYDLRQTDLIAGGEGAPITPLADWVMFKGHADVVLNLGGICNATFFSGSLDGFDICPCNLLLDGLIQRLRPGTRFDKDGAAAASGRIDVTMFSHLFESLIDSPNHRTLGRENYTDAMLDALVKRLCDAHSPADILASAVEAIANTIGTWVVYYGGGRVVVAGGGARNRYLIERLKHQCNTRKLRLSDDLGIPCEAREAMGFAVLGALARDGVDITLPQVTGRGGEHVPRAGAWVYPG